MENYIGILVGLIYLCYLHNLCSKETSEQIEIFCCPEFCNGFVFDLADTFNSNIKLLSDFFKRKWAVDTNTIAIAECLFLTLIQCFQGTADFCSSMNRDDTRSLSAFSEFGFSSVSIREPSSSSDIGLSRLT